MSPSWFVRTLREGMSGADVEMVQRKLRVPNEVGFGPLTAQKLRGFLWMNNLDRPDAVVDAEVARKLGE